MGALWFIAGFVAGVVTIIVWVWAKITEEVAREEDGY